MITRDESSKDIKEVDKILPKQFVDILVIVDDLATVWGSYYTHLVGIVPFYYFKDAVMEKLRKEGKEENRDLPGEESIQKVFSADCFLKFLPVFLQRIHRIYFQGVSHSIPKVF